MRAGRTDPFQFTAPDQRLIAEVVRRQQPGYQGGGARQLRRRRCDRGEVAGQGHPHAVGIQRRLRGLFRNRLQRLRAVNRAIAADQKMIGDARPSLAHLRFGHALRRHRVRRGCVMHDDALDVAQGAGGIALAVVLLQRPGVFDLRLAGARRWGAALQFLDLRTQGGDFLIFLNQRAARIRNLAFPLRQRVAQTSQVLLLLRQRRAQGICFLLELRRRALQLRHLRRELVHALTQPLDLITLVWRLRLEQRIHLSQQLVAITGAGVPLRTRRTNLLHVQPANDGIQAQLEGRQQPGDHLSRTDALHVGRFGGHEVAAQGHRHAVGVDVGFERLLNDCIQRLRPVDRAIGIDQEVIRDAQAAAAADLTLRNHLR